MRTVMLFAAVACLGASLPAQTAQASPEVMMHVETSFEVVVHASYAETAPLFGPQGERAWAGEDWDPKFIHPQPAQDREGMVFKVKHGPFSAVWVNTLFDVNEHHFQYVYFLPDIMVTTIDVRFKPVDAGTTRVDVTYARTAVTVAGNEHVATLSEGDRRAGKEWQQAIDKYLAKRKEAAEP